MPHPPISGGHKRTLRLMEAIARAGAIPHLLTVDRGQPGAADELRARDWRVDVPVEAPPSLGSRLRQHAARRPGQYLSSVDRRLRELAPGAAFVQFEHPLNAYYWNAIGSTRSVLSTHNVDSQVLRGSVRDARGFDRARLTNRALAMRSAERRAARRADAVLAVSEHDRRYFSGFSERVLIAANGVDAEFFELPAEVPDNHDILFFANYNHQPNADGIGRFLAEGWPRIAALDRGCAVAARRPRDAGQAGRAGRPRSARRAARIRRGPSGSPASQPARAGAAVARRRDEAEGAGGTGVSSPGRRDPARGRADRSGQRAARGDRPDRRRRSPTRSSS